MISGKNFEVERILEMQVTRKAYAKINLGLDVTGKRDDGYHLVRMIMQNIDIYDTLTFADNDSGDVSLSCSKEGIPTDGRNLICKVAEQLRKEYGISRGVDIHLDKVIPAAAGMAGGSTDAAAAYHALNELWELGMSREDMCRLAVKLGADIPYCIVGGTALSEGIGEVLTPIKDLAYCPIVIAKPGIDVSTGWVYTELDNSSDVKHPDIDGIRAAIEADDIPGMCALIDNVLEPVTTAQHKVIKDIEKILSENGAIGAFMTGSGPTVFAIYDDVAKAEKGLEAVKKSGLAPDLFLTKPINPGL